MQKSRLTVQCLAALAVLGSFVPASAIPRRDDNDDVGLNINQTEPAVFPNGVQLQGVHSGEVRMVVSVDAEGQLADYVVLAYTNKAFVASAIQAVKTWTYEPARVRGRPHASRVDLSFIFKSDLNVSVLNADVSFIEDRFGVKYIFKPFLLRDLDHIPTPVHVVTPAIPEGVLAPGETRVVTVEFYIDQEGRVRVPAVAREDADDRLATVAVAAVEQWRFEPPMREKQPVLVLAQQDFRFVAKPK